MRRAFTGLGFGALLYYVLDHSTGILMFISWPRGLLIFVLTLFMCVASGLHQMEGISVDSSGNVYIADYVAVAPACDDCDETHEGRVVRVTPGGVMARIAGGGKDQDDNGPATGAAPRKAMNSRPALVLVKTEKAKTNRMRTYSQAAPPADWN